MAWAAGLWVLAFNAKKASVVQPGGSAAARLDEEASERLAPRGRLINRPCTVTVR
ncbi:hypothetical protein ACFVUW_12115 [Streptomyces xiamenensis]|uniref:hypothetical protein n=1 Tax=Streptomyces xiamenensis TaxID=408015 RepID=UPI0036F0FF28